MTFSLKKFVSPSQSTAQIVDGHLILSLLNAAEPVVWRMALEKIGTASFEVKQDSDSTITKLILKPKKGTAEIIAPFKNKEEAIEALTAASNALQKETTQTLNIKRSTSSQTQGNTEKQSVQPVYQKTAGNSEAKKWSIAVFGALAVLFLYYYLTTLIPEQTRGFGTQNTAASTPSNPQQSTGVPVSADDFLSGL